MTSLILDRELIDDIRRVEQATGRNDLFSGFVQRLEMNIADFSATFAEFVARGDANGAARVAHTLKGSSRQLGAQALGELFADIERAAKAGQYAEAQRAFDAGAELIAESLQALKNA